MELIIYYVCPLIWKWMDITLEASGVYIPAVNKVDMISPNNSVGFMEVYTTLEDFKKDYPDQEPLMVKAIKGEK